MKDLDFNHEISMRMKSNAGEINATTTIAVMANQTLLLMGKRRDNGKWTMPGGGLNPKESPIMGALRELQEEAGVEPGSLSYLGSEIVEGRSGRLVCVYCYRLDTFRIGTNSSRDPDSEVENWEWVDVASGIPGYVARNLQSPRNVLLKKLGLQKWVKRDQ